MIAASSSCLFCSAVRLHTNEHILCCDDDPKVIFNMQRSETFTHTKHRERIDRHVKSPTHTRTHTNDISPVAAATRTDIKIIISCVKQQDKRGTAEQTECADQMSNVKESYASGPALLSTSRPQLTIALNHINKRIAILFCYRKKK